jgi:uncharacterized SAM-binding protein YcdF (DUF218 family)
LTNVRPSHKTPKRRLNHRRTPARPRRLSWQGRVLLASALAVSVLLAWGMAARLLAPSSNTGLAHFDAIIVLGNPADSYGNPTPVQLARVTEGVREYERGVAPRLIFTGGAVLNRSVEARVMARSALAAGIPASAIFVEPEARNTMENACYAVRIMKAHDWQSAEVVSSASHLPRAGMIFRGLPLAWRTHAAPPLAPESAAHIWAAESVETMKTVRYLIWARWADRCEP